MSVGHANNRGKDAVALVALVAAAGWTGWLMARQSLALDSTWTDGEGAQPSLASNAIRHAVWEEPTSLGGEFDSAQCIGRPALSPDGHVVVFAVGERGLNVELWVAAWDGENALDPRPLSKVNSSQDELSPAFSDDALWFASDRGGAEFGLDIWRAPFEDGRFETPVSAGSGLNSKADDTDPFPIPGSADLVFASNRARGARTDFDLYAAVAKPMAASDARESARSGTNWIVGNLANLNSPFEEREPALTPDSRTLLFASDRSGTKTSGAGSRSQFDLYRSFRSRTERTEAWLPPVQMIGLNSAASERAPLPTDGGFSLLFERTDQGNSAAMLRARSRELFRLPQPPLSLQDLLILVILVSLAVLALLAKRWHAIDVIYKCLMISLLVHLGLMLWFREVIPESEAVTPQDIERTFRVRLASQSEQPSEAQQERDGELAPARQAAQRPAAAPELSQTTSELSLLENAQPGESSSLQAAPRATASTPSIERPRETQRATEQTSFVTQVAQPQQLAATKTGSAPDLLLEAPPSQARSALRAVAKGARDLPRSEIAPAEQKLASAEPGSELRMQTASATGGDRPQEPGRARSSTSRESPDPAREDQQRVAAPQRLGARPTSEAPSLELSAPAGLQATPRRSATAGFSPGLQTAGRVDTRDAQAVAPGESSSLVTAARPFEMQGNSFTNQEQARSLTDFSRKVRPLEEAIQTRQPDSRGNATRDTSETTQAPPALELSSRSQRSRTMKQASGSPQRFASASDSVAPESRPAESPSRTGEMALEMEPTVANLGQAQTLHDSSSRHRPPAPVEVDLLTPALPQGPTNQELLRPSASTGIPVLALETTLPSIERERTKSSGPSPYHRSAERGPKRTRPISRPEERPLVAAIQPARPMPDQPGRSSPRNAYSNRFGSARLRALEEFGGGQETEQAVADGLRYLASIQNRNGSWGDRRDFDRDKYRDVRIGKTGLALLAFLGAGHLPGGNSEYAHVSETAVSYLVNLVSERTGHIGDGASYSHGIATYALAECYALTQDASLRAPLKRAVARVLVAQDQRRNPRQAGGWGYYFSDGAVWNDDRWPRVSVTVWQIMALESARLGGLEIPDSAFDAARQFVAQAWDRERGVFRYNHDPSRLRSRYAILPASTPAALFALSLLDIDIGSRDLEPAWNFINSRRPNGYRFSGDDDFVYRGQGNLYFWYYGSLACFRRGGNSWRRWNIAMQETLLPAQEEDGSWRPLSTYARFAGDDENERTYTTALSVLTLEVYYRYFTPLLRVRKQESR